MILGVELVGDWLIISDLEMCVSYIYMKLKQKIGDFWDFLLVCMFEYMVSLCFDWMMLVMGLDVWFLVNYYGIEIVLGLCIGINGSLIMINGVEGCKYGVYIIVDLGVNYQINDCVCLNVVVYNVLNEEINEIEFNIIKEGCCLWLGLIVEF